MTIERRRLLVRSRDKSDGSKLLGSLPFVSRTFEGSFTDSPFVLDLDANLHLGPADHLSRDEHSTVEVVFRFLLETGRIGHPVRELLRDRRLLLDAFDAFDEARQGEPDSDFRVRLHGTYDGEPLDASADDDLPAGPCGVSVNEVKLRFYRLCRRLDEAFDSRELSDAQREAEARVWRSAFARDER